MRSLKKYNVLIVDDASNWRDVLGLALEDFSVTVAKDAADALEALAFQCDTPFDVAIIDKNLSLQPNDNSGFTLAKEVKAIAEGCQIVILTGYSDVASTVAAFTDVGVFHYLEKFPQNGMGFDHKTLREVVLRAILENPVNRKRRKAETAKGEKRAKTNILHISDLHFGQKHRFAPSKYDSTLPQKDIPTLARLLAKDIEQQHLSVDLMVVSGDLAESGDMAQFKWARQELEKLCDLLRLSKEQVIIVPGNHDVQWLKPEDKSMPEHEPIGNYRTFYELFYKHDPKDKDRLFHVVYDENRQIAVVGLDSCVIEGAETAGIGYVGERQLDNALDEMRRLTKKCPDCIKVAVLHHHLMPVEPISHLPLPSKQFSLVMDASAVLRRLYQEHFAVVLHGHQHQPYCADFRLHEAPETRSASMAIIGVGSIGAERSELGNIARNHYNLIEIDADQSDLEIRIIGRQSSSQTQMEFAPYTEAILKLTNVNGLQA